MHSEKTKQSTVVFCSFASAYSQKLNTSRTISNYMYSIKRSMKLSGVTVWDFDVIVFFLLSVYIPVFVYPFYWSFLRNNSQVDFFFVCVSWLTCWPMPIIKLGFILLSDSFVWFSVQFILIVISGTNTSNCLWQSNLLCSRHLSEMVVDLNL